MKRRSAVACGLVVACWLLVPRVAGAHAGLQASDPAPGVALGAPPTAVRLSFSENASATLSTVRVLDRAGGSHEEGRPQPTTDPRTLDVRLARLPDGVYTVDWRIVSAVDGHTTAGAFAFGVGVDPTAVGPATSTAKNPPPSAYEVVGRWVLIGGLVLLVGAAAGGALAFGDPSGGILGLAGWLASAVGLVVLADAQRRNAGASFADLLDTSVGRALLWRGAAIVAAGVAVAAAARARAETIRRPAMALAAVAAMAAIAVHVAAGHAAAGSARSLQALSQWAHFAAVGVWIGGLAALILHVRGAPSTDKAAAVRRFAALAVGGLAVVTVTGGVRALNELTSWREVADTGYGRAVVAKILLIGAIALLAARNRWRSLPALETTLEPLRRTSRGELVLAGSALVVAAMLGSLAPPASARTAPPAIAVTGIDVATTVRVKFTAASRQPGPNRFTVRAVDYDSRRPVGPARVSLRFTALDDPDLASTTLALTRAARGSFAGEGANLVFDGRWRVDVLIQRAADSVTVPVGFDVGAPASNPSIVRPPGGPPSYTVEASGGGFLRVTLDPERAGGTRIVVTCFDFNPEVIPVDRIAITVGSRALPVVPIDRGTYSADAVLRHGRNRIGVVTHTTFGVRQHAFIDIDVA